MVPGQFLVGSWPWGLFRPPEFPAGDGSAAPEVRTGAGVQKPFVERVPDVEPRLRRFTEKVSLLLNSLLAAGYLVQTAPGTFVVDPLLGASGGVTADGRLPGHYSV